MKEKTIFIFEAVEGMYLSRDVVLPDGHLVASADTALTMNLIERISDFHVLEIMVEDGPRTTEVPTYFEKVRKTKAFQEFSKDYTENVSQVKDNLNKIITNSSPVSIDELIKGTTDILAENKNSLHLFDMLHSMREFDDITYVHSVNVALISSIIGQWVNFSKDQIKNLVLCGLLHDIGKLLIPPEILSKPGKLDSEEYTTIKTHVSLGFNILSERKFETQVSEACLLHHERSDGSGYPFGLKSDKIPTAAKIIAIADVYDAMTSNRVYRGSICPFDVVRDMEAGAYNQFDPKFLIPFLNNVVSSYLHNNVKLSDGSVGEVIMINPTDLSRPVVACNGDYIDLSRRRDLNIKAIM